MKKFLTILLTIVTISVNAQYIIYRSGNAYYYNNSTATWTKLDTTLVRILAGITHTTLAYGDHNHSGIYLPISGTAANSLLFMGKDTNQLKASWAPKIPFLISGNNYPTSSTYVSFDEKYNDIITYGPNSSVAAINQQSNGNGSNQTKVLLEILVNGDGKSTNLGVYRGHIDLNVSSVTTYDKTLKIDSAQGTKINDTTLISYIKYHAPAGTFNDSTLKYNSTRKTFAPYANYASAGNSGSMYSFTLGSSGTYPFYGGGTKEYAFQNTILAAKEIYSLENSINTYSYLSTYAMGLKNGSTHLFYVNPTSDFNNYVLNTDAAVNDTATIVVISNNDATKVKIKGNGDIKTTGFIRTGQKTGALTDGAPTDSELDTATGSTPGGVGAGWQCFVKDSNGSGLVYRVYSDGTNWYYSVMTQAL